MASVVVAADLILVACQGLRRAIYAEVGGGTLAPVTALLKPEYSELLQKIDGIESLAQFAVTHAESGKRVLLVDEEFRLLCKFFSQEAGQADA